MARYAVLLDGVVVEPIVEGEVPPQFHEDAGRVVIDVTASPQVREGWRYHGGAWDEPVSFPIIRPPPIEVRHDNLISAGCCVISSANSKMNGTYAIDSMAEAHLLAWSAGSATWPGFLRDSRRVKHEMTLDEAKPLISAILGYIDTLDEWVAAGGEGAAPPQPVEIA